MPVDPILQLIPFFGLAQFAVGTAEREQDLIAVHAGLGALFGNRLLHSRRQGIGVEGGHGVLIEIEERRQDFFHGGGIHLAERLVKFESDGSGTTDGIFVNGMYVAY